MSVAIRNDFEELRILKKLQIFLSDSLCFFWNIKNKADNQQCFKKGHISFWKIQERINFYDKFFY